MGYTILDRLLKSRKTKTRQKVSSFPTAFGTLRTYDSMSDYVGSLLDIVKGDKLTDATARTLASVGKTLMVKYTRKFENTGALSKNFYIVKTKVYRGTSTYGIYNKMPYDTVWTHPGDEPGAQGLGNTERLRAWMNGKTFVDPFKWQKKSRAKRVGKGGKTLKPLGSKLGKNPTKEQIEASALFLISRSIREARNNNPSKKSRLRRLGGGDRVYNYPVLVERDMVRELEKVRVYIIDRL
jgi:hypothetical protein